MLKTEQNIPPFSWVLGNTGIRGGFLKIQSQFLTTNNMKALLCPNPPGFLSAIMPTPQPSVTTIHWVPCSSIGCFTSLISLNPHNNPRQVDDTTSPFYRSRNGCSERLSHLSKVTQHLTPSRHSTFVERRKGWLDKGMVQTQDIPNLKTVGLLHSMWPPYPTSSRDLCNLKEHCLGIRTTCFL